MRKFVFTILLSVIVVSGFTQEVWSLEAITHDMSMEDYRPYVFNIGKYKKLKVIAHTCSEAGEYEKAVMAYEYMADEFIGKISKQDVGDFYACMLKVDRIDDLPYEGLQEFSKDFSDLLRIARIRREVRDDKGEANAENVKNLKSEAELSFGYTLQGSNKLCMHSDSLNQLYVYEFKNGDIGNPELIESSFRKRYRVLSMEKALGETEMYTIFDEQLGLYQIQIIGDDLPKFTHNSRYFSTAMPWFDSKTECLFFCSDDTKGYGGWDIYYTKLSKGKWLKSELMDERVNTPLNEIFPSVYKDMLLFSSDGRKGKGGLDNYAFDMKNNVSYNLFDCNSALSDYCIRLVNDSTDFFICREKNILNGSYADFWQRAVKEEDLGAAKTEQGLKNRMKSFSEEAQSVVAQEFVVNKIPEVYAFDSGKSIYFPSNTEVFDKSFYAYLDQCIEYFTSKSSIQEVLIFGSADPRGSDVSNYLLSLKRARRIIAYMKRHSDKKFTYRTVALGEQLYKEAISKSMDEYREVFFQATNVNIPFDTMIAVQANTVSSLELLAEQYNNPVEELKQVNELFAKNKFSDIYMVGIQTIHRVYEKETLFALAERYSCSVDNIMLANGKTSPIVKPGELIIIPLAK